MAFSPLLQQLIEAMRCLPGVGPKSAQRMAFHLLEHREPANLLSSTLKTAIEAIGHCEQCRNYTENTHCTLCQNTKRDPSLLCIVETPADVIAIENSHSYRGFYFVLHGRLSPLDGMGPDDIGITLLEKRFTEDKTLKEIIIATNATAEGEATSYYISKLARQYGLNISRIAHGIPMGGELEYIDGNTLALALTSRKKLEDMVN